MELIQQISSTITKRKHSFAYKSIWDKLHLDLPLFIAIMILTLIGLICLFSASNGNLQKMSNQIIRVILGIFVMISVAQINPIQFKRWTSTLFWVGVGLLLAVNIVGYVGKGAQRWIDIGIIKFQPSEIMKCAMPMMISLQLSKRPLPPTFTECALNSIFICIPCLLIFKQPDLGTSLLILFSGFSAFALAGLNFRKILYTITCFVAVAPIAWNFLHAYQKNRILTFINPERDPLGTGYHIIQSKIAIGSGGLFGKGWQDGTQSYLHYLPESSTDFIFSLAAEEFGFIGASIIILLFSFITCRVLYLSQFANDTYSNLLTSTLGISFFLYALINIGMVSGLLPVVGVPLPLISYGGTSMITVMLCFGIILSINSHRKLANN